MIILLFFGELLFLFFLSRSISSKISQFVYTLTRSSSFTIYFLAFLFLPGTIIHELAHAVSATFLLVRIGEMEFMPKMHGDSLKLGSVQVAVTDPIRRAIIGFAPVVVGLSIIFSVLFYFSAIQSFLPKPFDYIVLLYILFEVGNSMFSSKKDLEGTIELLLAVCIIVIVGFLLGLRIPKEIVVFFSSESIQTIIKNGCIYLLFPIMVDTVIIILTLLMMQGSRSRMR